MDFRHFSFSKKEGKKEKENRRIRLPDDGDRESLGTEEGRLLTRKERGPRC